MTCEMVAIGGRSILSICAFYWFRMRKDIYTYVKICAKCNTNKKPQCLRRAELGQYRAGAPIDPVMVDIIDPLSKTPRGNTVTLMLFDQFTKRIKCYPLHDQSAEIVIKTVVEDFFAGLETHKKYIQTRDEISSVTCSHPCSNVVMFV